MKSADHPEQRLGFAGQLGRRGFIHHEDVGVVGQRPSDLDHLLTGHGEIPIRAAKSRFIGRSKSSAASRFSWSR